MTSPRHPPRRRVGVCAAALLVLAAVPCVPSWCHVALDDQVAALTRRIRAAPADAALYLRRAELHRARGAWSDADADYRRARALDPGLEAVDLGLGRLRLEAGEPGRARDVLTRFLERRPHHAGALRLRAAAAARLGDHRAAAADGERVIAALAGASAGPDDYLALARAYEAAGRDHFDRALAALDRGVAALGPLVALVLPAVDLEVALGRSDAALARLDRIAPLYRRKEAWHCRRGAVLEAAGRGKEAIAAYGEALRSLATLAPERRSAPAAAGLEREAREALRRLRAEGAP
jgi:predicted Zn-dependent protease